MQRSRKVGIVQFYRYTNDRHCANNGGDITVMLLDDKGNQRGSRTSEPRKY